MWWMEDLGCSQILYKINVGAIGERDWDRMYEVIERGQRQWHARPNHVWRVEVPGGVLHVECSVECGGARWGVG